MNTYNELINRFEIFDNPPSKKGYDRHHIAPESEQVEMYGSVTDNRQIYCSLPMHMWLHILYDRENGTNTADWFLKLCGKPIEFFTCYELCLAYSYTLRKKREESNRKAAEVMKTDEYRKNMSDSLKEAMNRPEVKQKISDSKRGVKHPLYGTHRSEETRQKISDAKKGNTYNKGRKWFNNSIISVMAYECPEGYVPGRIYQRRTA